MEFEGLCIYMQTYSVILMQRIELLNHSVILFSLLNNSQTVIESGCTISTPASLYEREISLHKTLYFRRAVCISYVCVCHFFSIIIA